MSKRDWCILLYSTMIGILLIITILVLGGQDVRTLEHVAALEDAVARLQKEVEVLQKREPTCRYHPRPVLEKINEAKDQKGGS